MNFLELFQMLGNNVWLYGGTFILILSLLVFVHEWGHYIVARLCGVRVETFSIGFGKEIAGFNDKHGTRWKISLIPLGGYVKLFGDVDPASMKHDDTLEDSNTGKVRPMTEQEKNSAFFSKPVWKRAAIVFAGPAINYIFAIIILTVLFASNGQPVTPPIAAAVVGDSSAAKHGFKPHDYVVSIDGKNIKSFEDIRREMMIGLDEEKHFVVERDGQPMDIYAKPELVENQDRFGFRHSRGMLGLIGPRNAIDVKTITKINDTVYGEGELTRVIADLQSRLGQGFTIEISQGQAVDVLEIQPFSEFNEGLADEESGSYGLLFVSDVTNNVFVKYDPAEAFVRSLNETKDVTIGTLRALGQIVTGTRSATELGGVIRIGALAGDMAQQGFVALVLFTALLSINLGLINLFPIPLLDGGHLVFYAVEAVSGKPIPDQIQEYAFRLGLVFLVCVMVFANLNDIMQLIL